MSTSSSGSSGPPITTAAIASQMVAAMNIVEPTLDLSVGTTMRKLIDIHAEQDAQVYANAAIAQYANSVTTLSGSALDSFVAQFGIKRFAAKYAVGGVTFTQVASGSTTQNQPVTISAGTQISTTGSAPVFFRTLVTFTLAATDSAIVIPVQAVLAGSAGNVGASNITTVTSPLNGISSVNNAAPTSGGTDVESDAALITRFQSTVFRSLTGTSPMFLGTALENASVTLANVIGAFVTHTEQIEISGGVATSEVSDAAFVYPYSIFMATDLTSASSQTNEGSFVLGATLSSGVAVSQVISETAVSLPAGTTLSIGSQTVIVSSQVTSSSTIPIQSVVGSVGGPFTPSATYTAGAYTVNFLYNTGSFLNPGIDFSLTATASLVPNPGTAPTLVAANTTSAGNGFNASVTLYYRVAFSDGTGTTVASPESSVAVSGSAGSIQQVTVSWTVPSGASQVFVYRGTASNGEQLLTILPSSTTSWIDLNANPTSGAYPTTNTTGVSVVINSLNSATAPDGLYQLQFNYIPVASRNNYAAGILNRVDVYVAGTAPVQAFEVVSFFVGPTTYSFFTGPSGGTTVTYYTTCPIFSGNPASPYYIGNFVRLDGTYPQIGNAFVALSFSPLLLGGIFSSGSGSIVSSQSIDDGGPTTMLYEQDYWGVNNVSTTGLSDTSVAGIEWNINSPFGSSFPTSGSPNTYGRSAVSVDYLFNAVEAQVDSALQQWNLLSQDVQVHQATAVPLNFYLVAILVPGVSLSTAQAAMTTAIQSVLSGIGFNGYLEPSAIIAAVSAVTGVQAVRFANSSDVTANAVNWSSGTSYIEGALVTNNSTGASAGLAWTSAVSSNLNHALPAVGISNAYWNWAGYAYAIAPVNSATGAILAPYSATYSSGNVQVVTAATFTDTTYPIFNGLFVTPTAQNLYGAG